MDNDLKRMLEGESGTFTIGPLTPEEFLQQIAESEMPGALFAKFCLENPHVQIGQRIEPFLVDDPGCGGCQAIRVGTTSA